MNQKIKNEYALYSNIALLNLKELVENNLDKEIKESNIKNNLIINNEYIFKNSKLLNFLKKNLTKDEYMNILPLMIDYLVKIRNLYSHQDPKYKTNKQEHDNQYLYEESFKKLEPLVLKSIQKSSKTPVFKSFKQKDWDNFIIQLFLYKNEWKEFKESIKIEFEESFIRGYKFKLKKYYFKTQFYYEIANYLKSFKDIKNKRKAFLNIAMKLINYYYKNNEFSIAPFKSYRRGLIIEIKFLNNDKDNNTVFLNLQGLRQLLLFLSINPNYQITKKLFSIKAEKTQEENKDDNYKTFKSRLSPDSKIDNIHLLKILNKALRYKNKKEGNYQQGLNSDLFNQLLQYLNLNNLKYINLEHIETDCLIKEVGIDKLKEAEFWTKKIKEYILNVIYSIEIYKSIFKEKEKSNNENIWKENPKLFQVEKTNYKCENIYKPLFDFKNKKDDKSNMIKNLVAPIALLYFKKSKNLDENNCLSKEDVKKLFINTENMIINKEKAVEIFKNKIWKEKAQLLSFKNLNIDISFNNYWSNYEIINSKLFKEIMSLLPEADFKYLLKKYNEYKVIEKELVSFAIKNEEYNKKDIRNYILHRSISKFGSWKKIEELL